MPSPPRIFRFVLPYGERHVRARRQIEALGRLRVATPPADQSARPCPPDVNRKFARRRTGKGVYSAKRLRTGRKELHATHFFKITHAVEEVRSEPEW